MGGPALVAKPSGFATICGPMAQQLAGPGLGHRCRGAAGVRRPLHWPNRDADEAHGPPHAWATRATTPPPRRLRRRPRRPRGAGAALRPAPLGRRPVPATSLRPPAPLPLRLLTGAQRGAGLGPWTSSAPERFAGLRSGPTPSWRNGPGAVLEIACTRARHLATDLSQRRPIGRDQILRRFLNFEVAFPWPGPMSSHERSSAGLRCPPDSPPQPPAACRTPPGPAPPCELRPRGVT